MAGEREPAEAAAAYAELLATLPQHHGMPRFDLILLGMGPDGHIASLFPNTAILQERQRPVAEVYVGKLDSWRLSLTLPVLNAARSVMLLICGEKKADVLRHVIHQLPFAAPLPIQLLSGQKRLHWFIDRAAARQL